MLTYELLSLKKQNMLNQSGFWVDREVTAPIDDGMRVFVEERSSLDTARIY